MLQVVYYLLPPYDPFFTNTREINPHLSLKHLVNAPGQELPWLPSPLSSSGDGWACCCVLGAWVASTQIDVVGRKGGAWSTLSLHLSAHLTLTVWMGLVMKGKEGEGSCFFPSASLFLSISPGTRFTLLLLWFHSSGWLSSSGSEGKLKTHLGDILPLFLTHPHSCPLYIVHNSFLRRVVVHRMLKLKLRVGLYFCIFMHKHTKI